MLVLVLVLVLVGLGRGCGCTAMCEQNRQGTLITTHSTAVGLVCHLKAFSAVQAKD